MTMSQSYSNPKVGRFLRHGVDALMNTFMTEGRSCDVTDALFSSFRDHNSLLCSSRLRHIFRLVNNNNFADNQRSSIIMS